MALIKAKQLKHMNYMKNTMYCSTDILLHTLILHIMYFIGYCHIVSEQVMYYVLREPNLLYKINTMTILYQYTTILPIYYVNISSQIVFCLQKRITAIFAIFQDKKYSKWQSSQCLGKSGCLQCVTTTSHLLLLSVRTLWQKITLDST